VVAGADAVAARHALRDSLAARALFPGLVAGLDGADGHVVWGRRVVAEALRARPSLAEAIARRTAELESRRQERLALPVA
jgi:hypothetical protein